MADVPSNSTSSSQYSHPAANLSVPNYEERNSSAFGSTELTPSESENKNPSSNKMKRLTLNFHSHDILPGSIDETHDFEVLGLNTSAWSPSMDQDDFASWIRFKSIKSPSIGGSGYDWESFQADSSSDVSELVKKMRTQLSAIEQTANDHNAALKQLTERKDETKAVSFQNVNINSGENEHEIVAEPVAAPRKKGTCQRKPSGQDDATDFSAQTSEESFIESPQLRKHREVYCEVCRKQQLNSYQVLEHVKNEVELLSTDKQVIERTTMASEEENKKLLVEMTEKNRRTEQENRNLKEKIDNMERQLSLSSAEASKKDEEPRDVGKLSDEMQAENERLSNELAQMQKELRDWKQNAKQIEQQMQETKQNAKDIEEKEKTLRWVIEDMQHRHESEIRDYESKLEGDFEKCKVRDLKILELTASLTEAVPKLDMLAQQNPPYEDLLSYFKWSYDALKEKGTLKPEQEKLSGEVFEVQQHAEKCNKPMVEKDSLVVEQQLEQKNRELNALQNSIVELKEEVDLQKFQVSIREEDFKEERDRANRIKSEHENDKQDWLLKEEKLKTAIQQLLEKAKEKEKDGASRIKKEADNEKQDWLLKEENLKAAIVKLEKGIENEKDRANRISNEKEHEKKVWLLEEEKLKTTIQQLEKATENEKEEANHIKDKQEQEKRDWLFKEENLKTAIQQLEKATQDEKERANRIKYKQDEEKQDWLMREEKLNIAIQKLEKAIEDEKERANRIKNDQDQEKQDWLLNEEKLQTAIQNLLEKAKKDNDGENCIKKEQAQEKQFWLLKEEKLKNAIQQLEKATEDEKEKANRIKDKQDQEKHDWQLKEEKLKNAIEQLEKAAEEENGKTNRIRDKQEQEKHDWQLKEENLKMTIQRLEMATQEEKDRANSIEKKQVQEQKNWLLKEEKGETAMQQLEKTEVEDSCALERSASTRHRQTSGFAAEGAARQQNAALIENISGGGRSFCERESYGGDLNRIDAFGGAASAEVSEVDSASNEDLQKRAMSDGFEREKISLPIKQPTINAPKQASRISAITNALFKKPVVDFQNKKETKNERFEKESEDKKSTYERGEQNTTLEKKSCSSSELCQNSTADTSWQMKTEDEKLGVKQIREKFRSNVTPENSHSENNKMRSTAEPKDMKDATKINTITLTKTTPIGCLDKKEQSRAECEFPSTSTEFPSGKNVTDSQKGSEDELMVQDLGGQKRKVKTAIQLMAEKYEKQISYKIN